MHIHLHTLHTLHTHKSIIFFCNGFYSKLQYNKKVICRIDLVHVMLLLQRTTLKWIRPNNTMRCSQLPIQTAIQHGIPSSILLTHWGGDNIAAISKMTFSNAFSWISLFVPKGPIDNIPALIQIMAYWLVSTKPLSETMMVSLLTRICIAPPQWVNKIEHISRQGIYLEILRIFTVLW